MPWPKGKPLHVYKNGRPRRSIEEERTARRTKYARSDKLKRRAVALRRFYGITPEQYDELFERQGGRCAICRKPPGARRLCVDHDHQTLEVRGLLCFSCNTRLGILEGADQEWLEAAQVYRTRLLAETPPFR